jgi:DNA-binding CsgD family transcriptional regulator
MAELTGSDLERVLTVVRSVGEAQSPDAFSQVVIEQVAALVPSDVVTFNEVDPVAGRLVFLMEPTSFPSLPETADHLAALADQHPLIRYSAETGDGSAKKISDFWTQEEFHASPLYQLVYRPIGIEYQMAVGLPAARPIVIGIVVNRADHDFSERDRAVLNMLRPHLVQAWHNAKHQTRLRALLGAASAASEEGGAGVVVLSDPPHELTPGSLISLFRYFGRPVRNGAFPARVERWLETQRSRLTGAGSLELLRPLRSEHDGQQMVLRYLAAQGDHPGALLLREEPLSPRRQSLESLGLTGREAEIVLCLIGGESNAAIGQSLHVSPATVKKHLDNIYTKLGVRGRGRLTAFVVDVLER